MVVTGTQRNKGKRVHGRAGRRMTTTKVIETKKLDVEDYLSESSGQLFRAFCSEKLAGLASVLCVSIKLVAGVVPVPLRVLP